MTVEKFEYNVEMKNIDSSLGFVDIGSTNGLAYSWSCKPNEGRSDFLRFSWLFSWDKLKMKGINRLSGSITVKLSTGHEQTIDVDLTSPCGTIKKHINTFGYHERYNAMFGYSLTPHYAQIEKVKEESLFMLTPSEQNDAILVVEGKKIHINKTFLSCFSKFFRALFSSNYKEAQKNEIPIKEISYNDFKLLLGAISPNTVFPTDETVEKLLELADRFMMPSVIRQVEHHLLQISKLGNEKKMLMAEKFGMTDLLEKSILEIDTVEKAKKWKQSPEFIHFSDNIKAKVFQKFF